MTETNYKNVIKAIEVKVEEIKNLVGKSFLVESDRLEYKGTDYKVKLTCFSKISTWNEEPSIQDVDFISKLECISEFTNLMNSEDTKLGFCKDYRGAKPDTKGLIRSVDIEIKNAKIRIYYTCLAKPKTYDVLFTITNIDIDYNTDLLEVEANEYQIKQKKEMDVYNKLEKGDRLNKEDLEVRTVEIEEVVAKMETEWEGYKIDFETLYDFINTTFIPDHPNDFFYLIEDIKAEPTYIEVEFSKQENIVILSSSNGFIKLSYTMYVENDNEDEVDEETEDGDEASYIVVDEIWWDYDLSHFEEEDL